MSATLVVIVNGRPAPQGSKTSLPGGGVRESSRHVRPWRDAVVWAVRDALERLPSDQRAAWAPPDDRWAYSLDVVFTVKRPTVHNRSGKHSDQLKPDAPRAPVTTPDLDKLIRSTLDGLADSLLIGNDSRVTEVNAVKAYPGGALDALDGPGAVLTIRKVSNHAPTDDR